MNNLARKFVEKSKQNERLFIQGIILKDKEALKKLEKNFNDYLFKICLYKHIKRTINYAAIKLKKKQNKKEEIEKLCLNILDEDFKEERLYSIPDERIDIIKEVCSPGENTSFKEIFCDKEILEAIKTLTDRQKEILYKCIVRDQKETLVAKELGVTKQAVNKTKNAALNKLRNKLGGTYNGYIQ